MIHNQNKAYIGTKVILARPMTNQEFAKEKNNAFLGDIKDGYRVEYPDLYVSWSPKEVFEEAYRLVTPQEVCLINDQFGNLSDEEKAPE